MDNEDASQKFQVVDWAGRGVTEKRGEAGSKWLRTKSNKQAGGGGPFVPVIAGGGATKQSTSPEALACFAFEWDLDTLDLRAETHEKFDSTDIFRAF